MFILNIIGYSFAGKTTYINNTLTLNIKQFFGDNIEIYVYDLKEFYRRRNITPLSFIGSKYEELIQQLELELSGIIKDLVSKEKENKINVSFLIIESSGINQAIRNIIKEYPEFKKLTILVWTPLKVIESRIKEFKMKTKEKTITRRYKSFTPSKVYDLNKRIYVRCIKNITYPIYDLIYVTIDSNITTKGYYSKTSSVKLKILKDAINYYGNIIDIR